MIINYKFLQFVSELLWRMLRLQSQGFLEVTEDNHEKCSKENQPPDKEFNPEPHEHETGVVTIQQHRYTCGSSIQLPESLDIN
jgi:hypothetical protein